MSEKGKRDELRQQPPDGAKAGERLEREPLLSVRREGGKTYISGEFDLDQLATEADEALMAGFANLRNFAEYDAQEALLEAVEALHERMRQLGISEAELARRMNVSRSYISRLINATPNLTVLSIAKWARALGGKVRINLVIDDAAPRPAPPEPQDG